VARAKVATMDVKAFMLNVVIGIGWKNVEETAEFVDC
jgi:hypothetical protein